MTIFSCESLAAALRITTFSTPPTFSTAISSVFAPIFSNSAFTAFRRSPFLHGTESNSDRISSGAEIRSLDSPSASCAKALRQQIKIRQGKSDSFDFIQITFLAKSHSRLDNSLYQFDLFYWRLTVRASLDFFHLLQRVETVNDLAEDGIFSVQAGRGRKHDEERGQRGVGVVGPRHREDAADVFARLAEFAFELANPFVGVMRLIVRAPLAESPLHDEAGNDAVKDGVVIPPRLRELQKVANVLRRQIGIERDDEVAQTGMKDDLLAHLVDAGVLERLFALRLDLDADDFDRRVELLFGVGLGRRYFIDDLDAFGDLAEGRELAVELRLGRRADEELGAVTVGLAWYADGRDRSSDVLDVAEFIGQLVQRSTAPACARRLRVFQQRVPSLNEAQTDRAMERRAVVEAGAGVFDERLDVLQSLGRKELEADHAEVGGDHRFEARGLFERDRRRLGAGQWRVLLARRLSQTNRVCQ